MSDSRQRHVSATLEWLDWFNRRRIFEPLGHVPPAQFEEARCRQAPEREQEAPRQMGLH